MFSDISTTGAAQAAHSLFTHEGTITSETRIVCCLGKRLHHVQV